MVQLEEGEGENKVGGRKNRESHAAAIRRSGGNKQSPRSEHTVRLLFPMLQELVLVATTTSKRMSVPLLPIMMMMTVLFVVKRQQRTEGLASSRQRDCTVWAILTDPMSLM